MHYTVSFNLAQVTRICLVDDKKDQAKDGEEFVVPREKSPILERNKTVEVKDLKELVFTSMNEII